jgi:hypothetical protein
MNLRIGVASFFGLMALLQSATALAADVETSVAPVCATQKQVERLAGLFAYNTKSAVHAVNVETQNPHACGIANVAFLRGARIGTVRTQEATFEIVEVLVVGTVLGDSIMAAKPVICFSLLKIEERAV